MKLLTLNSEKLLKNLGNRHFKKFVNNSIIILVSADLRSNEIGDKVTSMPQLIPAPAAVQIFQSNDIVKYNEVYFKYLQTPAISVIIATLLHRAADEDKNIIFLCSKSEDNYGYLELLSNYCRAVYEIEPVRLKDVVKDKSLKQYDSNPDDIREVCNTRIERAIEAVPDVIDVVKSLFSDADKKKKKKGKKKKK